MISYKWNLSDGYPEKCGLNVFTCFSCGGGSSMGYKLAGCNILGNCEIDEKINKIYNKNHHPKYSFNCDIRDLIKTKIPEELLDIDILDGSPPCTSFSLAGVRERDWGKKKAFKEGGKKQVLDDLFFYFLDFAKIIKPKIIIAENVKGLLLGNAKGYLKQIYAKFDEIGYKVQVFLLNSATMGVPQSRERVFFIAHKKEYNFPKLVLNFDEKPILFKEISDNTDTVCNCSPLYYRYWKDGKKGKPIGKFAVIKKLHPNRTCFTITAGSKHFSPYFPRTLNKKETCLAGSFPLDYDFCGYDYNYLIGMSVPPIMMYKIVDKIKKQWFNL